MLDPTFIDELKANAETLLNASKQLYDQTQTMTANKSIKDTSEDIVAVEGYLELVKGARRDTNKSRKLIVQDLNAEKGIGGTA